MHQILTSRLRLPEEVGVRGTGIPVLKEGFHNQLLLLTVANEEVNALLLLCQQLTFGELLYLRAGPTLFKL